MIATIFDCETSGLIDNHSVPLDKQPHIIEFYACSVDLSKGPEIIDELNLLIKPPIAIPEKITKITTLNDAVLSNAPPFAEVAEQIKVYLERADTVIAHNASFDTEMVNIEFERLGQKVVWPRTICTVEASIFVKGHRLTLSKLHEHLFNEPFAGAHRAAMDVSALTRCCREMFHRGWL